VRKVDPLSASNADQAEEMPPVVLADHDRRDNVSVREAIHWANQARCPVTLYIYDANDGTTELHFNLMEKRFPETDSEASL
jgi:hypothetical protein